MSPGSWLCFANGRHWWEIRGWKKTGMSFSVLDNFSSNSCIYFPDSSSHEVSLPCFLILWINLAPEIWFDCSSLVLPASGYWWLSAVANLWTTSLSPVCFSTLPSTMDPTAYIIFPLFEILRVFLFSWLIEAGKKLNLQTLLSKAPILNIQNSKNKHCAHWFGEKLLGLHPCSQNLYLNMN